MKATLEFEGHSRREYGTVLRWVMLWPPLLRGLATLQLPYLYLIKFRLSKNMPSLEADITWLYEPYGYQLPKNIVRKGRQCFICLGFLINLELINKKWYRFILLPSIIFRIRATRENLNVVPWATHKRASLTKVFSYLNWKKKTYSSNIVIQAHNSLFCNNDPHFCTDWPP